MIKRHNAEGTREIKSSCPPFKPSRFPDLVVCQIPLHYGIFASPLPDLDFSVGVGAFVIWLSQIASLFSSVHDFNIHDSASLIVDCKLQIMDTRVVFPCLFRNVVIDSINLWISSDETGIRTKSLTTRPMPLLQTLWQKQRAIAFCKGSFIKSLNKW